MTRIRVEAPDDEWYRVSFDYDESLVSRIKEMVPGAKWNPAQKEWMVYQSMLQTRRLGAFLRKMEKEGHVLSVSERAESEMDAQVQRWIDPFEKGREYEKDSRAPEDDPLYDFQRNNVEYIKWNKENGSLIAASMGLGKTVVGLFAMEEQGLHPTIVVCPASVKEHWRREVEKWTDKTSFVCESMDPEDYGTEGFYEADYVIINYAILGGWLDLLQDLNAEGLLIDELHYVKNHKAKRSKRVHELSQDIDEVVGLTGTPIVNSPIELAHPLRVMGMLENFGGFKGYTSRYCPPVKRSTRSGQEWRDYSEARNLDELHKMLRKNCMIRTKREDVLEELPPIQRTLYPVDIDNPSEYEEAEDEFISWYREEVKERVEEKVEEAKEDGSWEEMQEEGYDPEQEIRSKVRSAMKAEALMKIGFLKKVAAEGKVGKVAAITEDAVEEGQSALVFTHHVDIAHELGEKIDDSKVVTGSTSDEERTEIADSFQNEEFDVLVATIGSMGTGVTLTAAHTIIFAELPWTPSDIDQAEARAYARLNDLHGIQSIYVVGQDTVDERVWDKLGEKRDIITAAIDGGETDYEYEVSDPNDPVDRVLGEVM